LCCPPQMAAGPGGRSSSAERDIRDHFEPRRHQQSVLRSLLSPQPPKRAQARRERASPPRALDGLTDRVVELGPGDGANFALYPTTVTEVIAVEPEPR
jgi:hypothetical protein